jgi:hypothetical protein
VQPKRPPGSDAHHPPTSRQQLSGTDSRREPTSGAVLGQWWASTNSACRPRRSTARSRSAVGRRPGHPLGAGRCSTLDAFGYLGEAAPMSSPVPGTAGARGCCRCRTSTTHQPPTSTSWPPPSSGSWPPPRPLLSAGDPHLGPTRRPCSRRHIARSPAAGATSHAALPPAPRRTQPCRRRHVADTTGGNPTPTTDQPPGSTSRAPAPGGSRCSVRRLISSGRRRNRGGCGSRPPVRVQVVRGRRGPARGPGAGPTALRHATEAAGYYPRAVTRVRGDGVRMR